MTDPLSLLCTISRPALLMQAARLACADHAHAAVLKRLLGTSTPPGPSEAVVRLLDVEAELEEARRARSAAYSPARHVEALAALLGEGRRLSGRPRAGQAKASGASAFLRAI